MPQPCNRVSEHSERNLTLVGKESQRERQSRGGSWMRKRPALVWACMLRLRIARTKRLHQLWLRRSSFGQQTNKRQKKGNLPRNHCRNWRRRGGIKLCQATDQ